ncbi:MAG: hypothetical protein OEW11_11175 [Nitrospirota bacterium]|nr:hypothetical protein [Nitrospirota bacterium]
MSGIFAAGRQYAWNILIASDQLGNALLGGDPDETISSRLGKMARAGKHQNRFIRAVGRVLDRLDPGHLRKSIEDDEGGRAVR